MVSVAFSSSFKKAFHKKVKNNIELEEKFWKKLEIFMRDPFSRILRTHKLSGRLKDLWSFTVEYDIRVIFFFEEKDKCVLVDVGTHEEVY